MNKAYNPIDWKNEPNTSTPINETNLNKMDRAIDTIDNRVIELDKNKVAKESGKGLSTNDFSYKYKETIDEMPEEFTIQNGYNYESGVFDSYLFMNGKSGTLPSGETYTLPVGYGEIAKETNNKIKDLAENGVFKNKERIDELNDSLADYGMEDIFDGSLTQYGDNKVYNTNLISVSAGNTLSVKAKGCTTIGIAYYKDSPSTLVSTDTVNAESIISTVPSTANLARIIFTKTGITPSNAPRISIYLNNAIDELKNDLGGVRFGIDENGNYGYIKAGADTVTPFSSGGGSGGMLYGSIDISFKVKPYTLIEEDTTESGDSSGGIGGIIMGPVS